MHRLQLWDRLMHVRHKVENVRLLIIEDEYFIMSDLHRILEGGGNVCVSYNKIEEDIYKLDYSSVEVVIIDTNLRADLSCSIANMLKEKKISFMFSAGCNETTIVGEHSDAPRLTKPYREKELIDAIAQLVGPPR